MVILETTLLLRLPKHLKEDIQAEAKRKGVRKNAVDEF